MGILDAPGVPYSNAALPVDLNAKQFRNWRRGAVVVTTTYAVLGTDEIIAADATAATFTVTLPTAASATGRVYRVVKTDAATNRVDVACTGSQTISGDKTRGLWAQGQALEVVSNGSNWVAVSRSGGGVTVAGVHVPENWGAIWRAKRDAAGSAPAVIGVMGDSICTSFYSSDLRLKGFVDLARTDLQTAYGNGGSGYHSTALTQMVSALALYNSANGYIDKVGTWVGAVGAGNDTGVGECYVYSNQVSPKPTLTFYRVRGTTLKIYHPTSAGGGSFKAYVNGGLVGTYTCAGASAQVVETVASGIAAGTSYTVVIEGQGDGAYTYINGVAGENSTGVRVNNYGKGGAKADDFRNNSGNRPAAAWSGGQYYPCDLLIYALGLGEAAAGYSMTQYGESVRSSIEAVKDYTGSATDLLFVMPLVGHHELSTALNWGRQVEVIRTIAAHYGAAMIDYTALFSGYYPFQAQSGWGIIFGSGDDGIIGHAGTDDVHPSDVGHALMAPYLINLLRS